MALLTGTPGDDSLVGTDQDDAILGLGGNDSINGGAGDDQITGGGGADSLAGGAGADGFIYGSILESTSQAFDNLYDFETGIDDIDLLALGASSVNIIRTDSGSYLFAQTPTGQLQLVSAWRAINGLDVLTSGSIYLANEGSAATLIGSGGDDIIRGGVGDDVIIGGPGADSLNGGSPGGYARGSGGRDVFTYLSDQDSRGSAFDVIHNFETGFDRIDVAALGLTNIGMVSNGLITNLYATTASGVAFQLQLTNELFYQNDQFAVADLIGIGSQGVTLVGDGRTNLVGGTGADTIYGAIHYQGGFAEFPYYYTTESFRGGGGGDLLSLGGGPNEIHYKAGDSYIADPDTVFGFVSGRDQVDLEFIGEYGIAYDDAGNSFLFADTNNDGAADMLIQFADVRLTRNDVAQPQSHVAAAPDGTLISQDEAKIYHSQIGDHDGWLLS